MNGIFNQTNSTALLVGLVAGLLSGAAPVRADLGITGASIQVTDANGNPLCVVQVRYRLASVDPAGKHYAAVPGTDRCVSKNGITYDLNGHPVTAAHTVPAKTFPQRPLRTTGYAGYIDCSNHYVDPNGGRHDVRNQTYFSNGQFVPLPPGVRPRDSRDCKSNQPVFQQHSLSTQTTNRRTPAAFQPLQQSVTGKKPPKFLPTN